MYGDTGGCMETDIAVVVRGCSGGLFREVFPDCCKIRVGVGVRALICDVGDAVTLTVGIGV